MRQGRKHRPGSFPRVIAVLVVGVVLSFLLATVAWAQSSPPNVGIPLTPTTDASGTVTTTATSPPTGATGTSSPESTASPTTTAGQDAAPPVTASTAPVPGAQAGQAAVIPPAAGFSPLNPGWKAAQMKVEVWPEYDKKAVLVILNFSLPTDVRLPATLKFAVPTGAVIAGIGEIKPDGSFKFNYANSYPPVQPGADWDIATIQVQEFRSLQIDYYYDPGLPAGAGGRSFPLLLQLPLDVGTVELQVQEPARATNFAVQPFMQDSGKAADGFAYAGARFSEVKAGSTLGQLISYSKPDGGLSKGTGSGESGQAPISTNTALLAAILIVLVCTGGFVGYRLYKNAGKARRGSSRPPTQPSPAARPVASTRQRPAASARQRPVANTRQRPATNSRDAATNQGKPVNRFCIACGEELPNRARYCPSCGGGQDA